MRSFPRLLLERLPPALFLLSLAALLFGLGVASERYGFFPRSVLDEAAKTARVTGDSLRIPDDGHSFRGFSDTPLDGFLAQRLEFVVGDSLDGAVLVMGGRHRYRDLCPEHGCLAVAVGPSGEPLHAWPFDAAAIHAANIAGGDYPYELNNFSPERDMTPVGIEQYPNGDLLVTFHLVNAFPYGGGVARIDRDGQPRWFRRDYSHHLPRLIDGDVAIVPGLVVGDGVIEAPNGTRERIYDCDGEVYHSAINILNGDGTLLEQIPVFAIMLASPWRAIFTFKAHQCDPFHLNSVDIVGVGGQGGNLAPGDLILSFRNPSAIAILDGATRELKRLVRGTFSGQHDVTHIGGSTVLLLDNQRTGQTEEQASHQRRSRLLMIDLATGIETTIFPTASTPEAWRDLHTDIEGSIDISPDRRRAIIAFAEEGLAVEARIADGAVLSVHRSLHDVSALGQFPGERLDRAAVFDLRGVIYLREASAPVQ